jgi:hypothetical protein
MPEEIIAIILGLLKTAVSHAEIFSCYLILIWSANFIVLDCVYIIKLTTFKVAIITA